MGEVATRKMVAVSRQLTLSFAAAKVDFEPNVRVFGMTANIGFADRSKLCQPILGYWMTVC